MVRISWLYIYHIYLSLCTQTADPNHFRGTHYISCRNLVSLYNELNTHIFKVDQYKWAFCMYFIFNSLSRNSFSPKSFQICFEDFPPVLLYAQEIEGKMVWFGLCWSSKVYTMKVDRREKLVEQSTNAILNPSARSENKIPFSWIALYHNLCL